MSVEAQRRDRGAVDIMCRRLDVDDDFSGRHGGLWSDVEARGYHDIITYILIIDSESWVS